MLGDGFRQVLAGALHTREVLADGSLASMSDLMSRGSDANPATGTPFIWQASRGTRPLADLPGEQLPEPATTGAQSPQVPGSFVDVIGEDPGEGRTVDPRPGETHPDGVPAVVEVDQLLQGIAGGKRPWLCGRRRCRCAVGTEAGVEKGRMGDDAQPAQHVLGYPTVAVRNLVEGPELGQLHARRIADAMTTLWRV